MIIAEIGVNHNGDMSIAKYLISEAINAGADAVKFQLFHIEKYKNLQLSEAQIKELHDFCHGEIEFLCTPFDHEAIDFLEPLVSRYKVASGQANDVQFLEHINSKGKPVILSTGMSEFADIRHSLAVLDIPVTLLHCVSLYPTPPEKAALWRIKAMQDAFSCPIGYSCHVPGINMALAAKTLGATVIEKHLTFDKNAQGPDHSSSILPEELMALVRGCKEIDVALSPDSTS